MTSGVLEINLNSIKLNWCALNELSGTKVETAAVVKANAYGLGVSKVAPFLWNVGVKTFFVSSMDEAVEMKSLVPNNAKIFCLNGYNFGDRQAVDEFDVIPIINSSDQLQNFIKAHPDSIAALQIDIGMNRLGLQEDEFYRCKNQLLSLNIDLIMGHLSSADEKDAVANKEQLYRFYELSRFFPKVTKSLSATGGILLGKDYHFNLTRPGIGLFGGYPFCSAEQVIRINLPILQVKTISRGDGVGYNHTFISDRRRNIAVVGAGYADGLFRLLSNRGHLFHNGQKCPIVGRISMDLITVDISSLDKVPACLEVLGPSQSIDNLADQAETIGYEILTNIGRRYKRVYHEDKRF